MNQGPGKFVIQDFSAKKSTGAVRFPFDAQSKKFGLLRWSDTFAALLLDQRGLQGRVFNGLTAKPPVCLRYFVRDGLEAALRA